MVGLLAAAGVIAAPAAARAADASAVAGDLTLVWIGFSAVLVMLMQVGFMLLESGLTRAKNAVNVAQKNLTDFALSAMLFALLGFTFMFGPSFAGAVGWFGWSESFIKLGGLSDADLMFFVFQAMFVGTAATIMSGAVAERFAYLPYMLTIPVVSLVIYPVFGHWAWGNLLIADNPTWLADLGFVDFAGSTVVHLVGACVALAAAICVGPRTGVRFEGGRAIRPQGRDAIRATMGCFLLYLGWLGFNGGSTLAADAGIAPILVATVLAGAAGGVSGMTLGRLRDAHFHPTRVINGVLGGLVGITAGVHLASPEASTLIGALGGVVAVAAEDLIAACRVDDPVGAVAVHGVAGVFGTLAVAVLMPAADLPEGGRLAQLSVQGFGVAVAVCWAFGLAFVWFKLLTLVVPIRVSERDEIVGLNVSEHATLLGTGAVQEVVMRMIEGDIRLDQRLGVDDEQGEAGELMALFNRLLDTMQASDAKRRAMEDEMRLHGAMRASEKRASLTRARAERDAEREIVEEIAEVVRRVSVGELDRRAQLTRQSEHLHAIGTGVNAMLDHVVALLGRTMDGAKKLADQSVAQQDMADTLADVSARQAAGVDKAAEGLRALREDIAATAANTDHTKAAADKARTSADDGAQAIERTVATMREIRDQSQRIASLLDDINDIASQTNLLAINAAVEAARAGEQGKGFAVVAQEVRALSSKTQEMSREIASRVQETETAVKQGVEVVSRTTDALGEIRANAAKTQADMEQIATASKVQAERAATLLATIEEIGSLGERNQAVAERSADAARLLSEETRKLSEAASAYSAGERDTAAPAPEVAEDVASDASLAAFEADAAEEAADAAQRAAG